MSTIFEILSLRFPDLQFRQEFILAPLTTVKIGGPAEVFCEIKDRVSFESLVAFCQKEKIPLTMLGWGANVLIADRGIRGLVVKYAAQQIEIKSSINASEKIPLVAARWQNGEDSQKKYPEFNKLDYSENDAPRVEVRIEAGVPLSYAINVLLQQGITGLQWFSRIPATVGGAIFNNIHGGTHFIGEFLSSVDIIDKAGNQKTLLVDELEFGYDKSRFHNSGEIIISASFCLYKGDVSKAKQVVNEWAQQKKDQPQNSLGCVFQNISREDQTRLQYPTPSVGYIIDQVLHKKGFQIGDAKISEKHAAFIENVGQATARDYLAVIKTITTEVKAKTGLSIHPEIFFKGFTTEELQFLQRK